MILRLPVLSVFFKLKVRTYSFTHLTEYPLILLLSLRLTLLLLFEMLRNQAFAGEIPVAVHQ